MEGELRYVCMSFGWYQELLEEAHLPDFSAAEATLVEMLDRGGMIVHAYRETDPDNPELVGRHARLRSFNAGSDGECSSREEGVAHEVERFLLDPASMDVWMRARETHGVVDERWSVVEFWSMDGHVHEQPFIYGKARLIAAPSPPNRPRNV